METFAHIKTLITIVLGLSITHLLRCTAKFVQHPGRERPYVLHLFWVIYLFLLLIHFWWWEYRLTTITNWSFAMYFFIILFAVTFYTLCVLLYPEDIKDYDGYKEYFFSRKKWFFSVLAISFILDFLDTLLKGKEYLHSLHIEYPIRNISHIVLCLLAIKINNRRFHMILVLLFILYELSWIVRMFWNE